jgi:uncharacterized repeat protein (TIGR01451 family)
MLGHSRSLTHALLAGGVVAAALFVPVRGVLAASAAVGARTTPPFTKVSLRVFKSVRPDPVVPGRRLTYTLEVTNGGPSLAHGVRVTDHLPRALRHFKWTCQASNGSKCRDHAGTGSIDTKADIGAHSLVRYEITGRTPAGLTSADNTGTAYKPAGAVDRFCDPKCSATVRPKVKPRKPRVALVVSKSVSPDPVVPGARLRYTLRVVNHGPADANGVRITDRLPLALRRFTWTCHAHNHSRCDQAAGIGSIDTRANITAGGAVVYEITGIAPSSLRSASNTGTAYKPAGTVDRFCDPRCSATVRPRVKPHVSLRVFKSARPVPVVPGKRLTYFLTVINRGPSDASGVRVIDRLPAAVRHFTWTCHSGLRSWCDQRAGSGSIKTLAHIAAHGSVTYVITGITPRSLKSARNTGIAMPPRGAVDHGCRPACHATVNPPIERRVSLAIRKYVSPNPVIPGKRLTYRVVVSNGGPARARGVRIIDRLAYQLRFFYWTCHPTAGSHCDRRSGHGSIDTRADIAARGSVTYTLSGGTPSYLATARNVAIAQPPADAVDPGCTPACSAVVNPKIKKHDNLHGSKTASPNPATAGKRLTFTITVRNNGPSDTRVRITDPLAPVIRNFTWTCRAWKRSYCQQRSGRGSINALDDVGGHSKIVYKLTGFLPRGTSGVVKNTAYVTPQRGNINNGCTPRCSFSVTVRWHRPRSAAVAAGNGTAADWTESADLAPR